MELQRLWSSLNAAAAPPPQAAGPQLAVSNALGSNMVLQRDTPSRLWGTAPPGEVVSVEVSGITPESLNTTALADGTWALDLQTRSAQADPSNITVSGSAGNKIQMTNVLFGDVWGCHGQSNMVHKDFH